jgi:large subunit ribosomal protein L29
MKARELRAKSVEDLHAELVQLQRAHFSLRVQVATQQSTKVSGLSKLRKDIARIRTLLAEKTGAP